MLNKLKAMYVAHREIIVYVFFGGLTTLLNWVTAYICNGMLGMEQTVSNAIAWLVGVIFAFFVNKLYVFESRSFDPKTVIAEAGGFVGARALSGVVEIFAPTLLVQAGLDQTVGDMDGALAKLVTSVAVIILNYIFSKFFVFTDGNDRAAGKTAKRIYAALCVIATVGAVLWLCRGFFAF